MRIGLTLFLVSGYILCSPTFGAEPTKDQLDFFEKKIRPVLVKHCYECHSADSKEVKGGLVLDTREGLRRGGESGGHSVVPGEPDESVLLEALRYESFEMPPDQQLPENVIADFEKWIKMGAPDPREGKSLVQKKIDFEAAKSYWAYQPLTKPAPPQTKTANWATTEIDKFLLAKMEAAGIKPVQDADPITLIRRVYFDVIGLPPTPQQVEEYLAKPTPEHLGEIVDRLLASPQFGERWGRHWLDVVRYGESTGMERNFTYPHAWRYRDYVIQAFNEDKPFNQFITEQIAGDLLPAKTTKERQEQLTATGFLAIGPKSLNERNREQFAMDVVDDQIDVTSRAFLGLTVACARCHDHKFDAIPQSEYYAMAGIYRSTDTYYGTGGGRGNRQGGELLALVDGEIKTIKPADDGNAKNKKQNLAQQLRKAEKQLANLEKREKTKAIEKRITQVEAQVKKLKRQIAKAKADEAPSDEDNANKPKALVMGVLDAKNPSDTELRVRGEPDDRGKAIPRGFLTVASRFETPEIKPTQSGRLELAQWIADSKNPLTARVAVNRFWQHLFGRGIVGTVNNFGTNGEKPTHPELLDYLAANFIENNWSVKQFVRSVVMSHAYGLSCASHEEGLASDPDNYLLWRQNQRRLEAEAIRDAMLLASGELDLTPADGSIVSRVGNGDIGRGIRISEFDSNATKRSVYLPIVRSAVPETLQVFDFPEPSIIAGQRDVTTVPTQALFMLNSPFVLDRSKALAERLLQDGELSSDAQRIAQAFRYTLCREPSAQELASAEKFLSEATPMSKNGGMQPEVKAWMGFCHVLLASSEFRYLQ